MNKPFTLFATLTLATMVGCGPKADRIRNAIVAPEGSASAKGRAYAEHALHIYLGAGGYYSDSPSLVAFLKDPHPVKTYACLLADKLGQTPGLNPEKVKAAQQDLQRLDDEF
jgi:hypothetical protein